MRFSIGVDPRPASGVRRWSWRAAVSGQPQSDECQSDDVPPPPAHGSRRAQSRTEGIKPGSLILSEGPSPGYLLLQRVDGRR